MLNGREFLEAHVPLPAAQQPAIVVVLTTSLHAQDLLLAQQLSVTDFLGKPLTRAKKND